MYPRPRARRGGTPRLSGVIPAAVHQPPRARRGASPQPSTSPPAPVGGHPRALNMAPPTASGSYPALVGCAHPRGEHAGWTGGNGASDREEGRFGEESAQSICQSRFRLSGACIGAATFLSPTACHSRKSETFRLQRAVGGRNAAAPIRKRRFTILCSRTGNYYRHTL